MIVPAHGSGLDRTAFETLLQALVLPNQPPWQRMLGWLGGGDRSGSSLFALELVGSFQGQAFLVRAAYPTLLSHLATQLQARFPSAHLVTVAADTDPLRQRVGEEVTIYELRRGGEHIYLPLRVDGEERRLSSGGVDPLLGLLAPLATLPEETRVVLQLALAPAPDRWSLGQEQAADRYSLYQVRENQQRQERAAATESDPLPLQLLLVILLGIAAIGLWRSHPVPILPLLAAALISLALLAGFGAAAARALIASPVGGLLRGRRTIYDTRQVSEKTERVAYRSILRLYAFSPAGRGDAGTQARWRTFREKILEQAVATYRQFHTANAGYFNPHRLSSRQVRRLLPRAPSLATAASVQWTEGVSRSSHLLTVAEIATLWHLPEKADLAELPFLQDEAAYHSRLSPRSLASFSAPWGLHLSSPPAAGPKGVLLGDSQHAGLRAEVRLTADILGRHTFALGGTGKGKSSLLLALARSWLEADFAGEPVPGLVLLDPHGDLAAALLQSVPAARQPDVLVLDLADTDYPFGLNPLDVTLGRTRDKACEDLMAVFAHIWASSWGYRMEDIWKASLKTLFEANEWLTDRDPEHGARKQYTLVDVIPLLSNKAFRRLVLSQIEDPDLMLWWERFATWDMRLRTDATLPVMNKVGNFGGSKVARRVLGQGRSTVDPATALASGRILVVHTAPHIVGPDTGALVGATILGLVQMALGAQANLPRAERRRTLVVIDEFQAIPGADYAGMLGELRKFGGVFVLATQSLSHLDRLDHLGGTLRSTVLSNISNLFAFGMSAEDARKIAPEMDGTITEQDLINLEDYACYARLTQAGQRLRTFSLTLALPSGGSPASERELRERSRCLVGRPQAEVEEDLHKAMQRRLAPTRQMPVSAAVQYRPDAESLPKDEPAEWWARQQLLKSSPRRRSTAADRQGTDRRTKTPPDA
jgi:hypothetical protein